MIYLDHAATTLGKPPQVAKAVYDAINHLGNAGRGCCQPALDAARVIYRAREQISKLFCLNHPQQVVFTSGITESINLVVNGLCRPGDHVITTELEHNSVLRPLYQKQGIELTILTCNQQGQITYHDLEAAFQSNTVAVFCTHASNVTGNLLDLQKIGKICNKHQVLLVVDSAQTAGLFSIDMQKDLIDILCFTGHKGLLGPQGIGGLCIRKEIELAPWKVGGSGVHSFSKQHPVQMPERLEAGTLNTPGIAGLSAALTELSHTRIEQAAIKAQQLMNLFYQEVVRLKSVTVYGDFSGDRAPIVSLNIGEYDSSQVSDWLAQEYQICTRPGIHCAPLLHQALGTQRQGAVRFSFSDTNTIEEVELAVKAVKEIADF